MHTEGLDLQFTHSKIKLNFQCSQFKQYKLPKRVTRLQGPSIRVIARADNTAPSEKVSHRWQAICNTLSALTSPGFGLHVV